MNASSLIWIPLLPLLGAALNLTVGSKLSRRTVSFVGCGSVLGALLVSLSVVFAKLMPAVALAGGHQVVALEQRVFDWITAGQLSVGFTLYLDALSAVMILVITFVGFLIHVYSVGYMHHDPGYPRFFTYLNLFCFAMLTLVLGNNFLVLFVGWEGVGLCSYLLIGFWFHDQAKAKAGMKAFVANRVGDFGFLLAMFLIFTLFGTLNFREVMAAAPTTLAFGGTAVMAICLLLFLGGTGKSAQIPLYV